MFDDGPAPIAFAHRGGAREAPENTMAAFDYAIGLGYSYIETDVRCTADGRCVVFHDATLRRLAGRPERIEDLSWSELEAVRIRGESIPLLEDVLGAWPDVRFNIDAKHDGVVGPLLDVLHRVSAFARVAIGAFSVARLRRVRELIPEQASTVMPLDDAARLLGSSYRLPTRPRAGGAVQVPIAFRRLRFDRPQFVDRVHALGLQVHFWTIDGPAEMRRLLDLGADGIMTDRPSVLRDVLVARGEWK